MGGRARPPRPFWIATQAGPVFAFHHAPEEAPREATVVLCRPFGHEAQCTQRSYRHLAERLCAAGFHVLRVDYHGTGDSSGGDADDDRLAAWVNSIRAAMAWARASLDAQKIVLFGARVGALVAMQAAAEGGVDAVVAFAPPSSGRAWLREARALQAMMVAALSLKGWKAPRDGEESAGFLLTKSTATAIGNLDPAAAAPPAALVVARDDLPGGEEKLVAALTARGVDVTLSRAPGCGAMMDSDPGHSVVPEQAWAEVTDWLSARFVAATADRAKRPAPSYSTAASVRETDTLVTVREEAVDVGGLFGILTEPVRPVAKEAPTVILHSIGANSHVGPNRMYVTMARRWAALGFRVLRFDITGVGDSPAREGQAENQVYSNGAEDSARAKDFLARTRNAGRFVLVGLCSGAYFSFRAALDDAGIAGVVLLNIQRFAWREGDPVDTLKRDVVKSKQFYWKAAFGADAWIRLARGEVNVRAIAQGVLHQTWDSARHRVQRALLGEGDVVRQFRTLLGRGTDVLVVLSADDGARNSVDAHLGANAACFRRAPAFRIEIIDGADHTFSPLGCQDVLLSLLTAHLVTRFAPEPAGEFAAPFAGEPSLAPTT